MVGPAHRRDVGAGVFAAQGAEQVCIALPELNEAEMPRSVAPIIISPTGMSRVA